LVDLDGDGHKDILSGSWPGELFLFRGRVGGSFAAPVKLKNKQGKTINPGGGIRRDSGNYVLVAGDARYETEGGKTYIVYEGEKIEVPKGKQAGITGTATAAHAADWDDDGDLDLLVGEISGAIYLIPNDGSAKEYAFGKETQLQAGGEPLRVEGDAGPFAADWDGDGDLDLLAGAGNGAVSLFENVGSRQAPKLAAARVLVPAAEVNYGASAPKEPRRGVRSKVCAADWNGDGRLDLLLGDFTTQRPDLPEPTAEEKAVHEKLRKELNDVTERYSALSAKLYGDNPAGDEKERDKLNAEMTQIVKRMQELRRKLPAEVEYHGWVWLFLRKGA
jgi:hypothetical protein